MRGARGITRVPVPNTTVGLVVDGGSRLIRTKG